MDAAVAILPPRMGKVLLTGGTGFIGRQVAQALLDQDREVEIVSSRPDAVVDDRAVLHHADLLDPAQRTEVVRRVGPSELVHLAWFLQPGQVWNSPLNVSWVEASLGLLLDFAEAGGRRAVFAGTFSEYGPEEGVCNEVTTPLTPSNLYGVCKNSLRAVGLSAAEQLDISLAWVRIFSAYGPFEHPRRLVASVARSLLAGEPAPVSHGTQVRDYLYTPDIGRGLAAILGSDLSGPVNLGSGEGKALREIVETIGEITERSDLLRFGEVVPPADDPQLIVADTERLRSEVPWQPSHSLKEGLELTVDWWRSQVGAEARPS
jgi:nucleoside-diphosphate-sugar epimerase